MQCSRPSPQKRSSRIWMDTNLNLPSEGMWSKTLEHLLRNRIERPLTVTNPPQVSYFSPRHGSRDQDGATPTVRSKRPARKVCWQQTWKEMMHSKDSQLSRVKQSILDQRWLVKMRCHRSRKGRDHLSSAWLTRCSAAVLIRNASVWQLANRLTLWSKSRIRLPSTSRTLRLKITTLMRAVSAIHPRQGLLQCCSMPYHRSSVQLKRKNRGNPSLSWLGLM